MCIACDAHVSDYRVISLLLQVYVARLSEGFGLATQVSLAIFLQNLFK